VDIYVGNLPWSVNDAGLAALCQPHGTVSTAKVIIDRETTRSRGFGFVSMPNPDEAQAAIKALDGSQLGGRALRVREAEPKGSRPPSSGLGQPVTSDGRPPSSAERPAYRPSDPPNG